MRESHVKIFINSVRVDCQDWNMQGNFSEDGMYWLDPDGGSHFKRVPRLL